MRLVQSILLAISAMIFLLIPIVLVYWVVDALNLEFLDAIKGILGAILEPFLGIIRALFGNKSFPLFGLEFSWAPVYFAIALLAFSLLLNGISKLIGYVNSTANYVKAKTTVHLVNKQREEMEKVEEQRLKENKHGFIVVRYKTQTTSSAYLTSSGLSAADIRKMFMDTFNKYMFLDATLESDPRSDEMCLKFEEPGSAINYALMLQENVKELNDKLDRAGTKVHVNVGVHAANSFEPNNQSFFVTGKVCNLAAPGEVSCSRLVRDIYLAERNESTLTFISKGMYDLGQEIEIFAVKKGEKTSRF